jgi:hypothetical protein
MVPGFDEAITDVEKQSHCEGSWFSILIKASAVVEEKECVW